MNQYIFEYASRLADFARQLIPQGLTTYWLWNEPNLIPPGGSIPASGQNCPAGQDAHFDADALSPENFGALAWFVATTLQDVAQSLHMPITIYLGSLAIAGNDPQDVQTAQYLTQIYQFLRQAHPAPSPWPWQAVSITLLGFQTFENVAVLRANLQAVLTTNADPAELIVAEWGTSNSLLHVNGDSKQPYDEAKLVQARCTFYAISQPFVRMYFFAHPIMPDLLHPDRDYGTIFFGQPSTYFTIDYSNPLYWRGLLQSL